MTLHIDALRSTRKLQSDTIVEDPAFVFCMSRSDRTIPYTSSKAHIQMHDPPGISATFGVLRLWVCPSIWLRAAGDAAVCRFRGRSCSSHAAIRMLCPSAPRRPSSGWPQRTPPLNNPVHAHHPLTNCRRRVQHHGHGIRSSRFHSHRR